ncbi:MAG: hypothetical protein FWG14_04805 [Peptococcaceae bacterium]|nr:hypothetical protein [Peptococcaceae bacterium]
MNTPENDPVHGCQQLLGCGEIDIEIDIIQERMFVMTKQSRRKKYNWVIHVFGVLGMTLGPLVLVLGAVNNEEAILIVTGAVLIGLGIVLVMGNLMREVIGNALTFRHSKNVKNGPLVKGTIVSVEEGAFINNHPELYNGQRNLDSKTAP